MSRSRIGRELALALLIGMLVPPGAAERAEPPLRLEDVVRAFVGGEPVDRLIERIGRSPVEFDLSDEMLGELRAAGLPPALIEAMVARQRELTTPDSSPAAPPGEEAPPTLRIRLDAPDELRLPTRLAPEIAARLGLGPDADRLTGVAIYVACTTSTIVPDHWRAASPLGRDFVSMPRHKILAFLPGTAADVQEGAIVYPVVPSIEVELDPHEPNDLLLGIAIEAGGRWYRLTDATLPAVRATRGARLEVEGRVAGGGLALPSASFVGEAAPIPSGAN